MTEIWKNINPSNLDGEVWKTIELFPDYQISNLGRVKSFKIYREVDENILRQGRGKYLFVRLYKNGKEKPKRIHVLLFETFNNYKLKEDEVIHHIDFNSINNNLDNLQKMDRSEHSILHMSGKHHSEKTKKLISEKMSGENNPNFGKFGKNAPNVILSEQKIIKINKLLDKGDLTQKEIARIFGVSQPTISNIKNKKIWK